MQIVNIYIQYTYHIDYNIIYYSSLIYLFYLCLSITEYYQYNIKNKPT